MTILVATLRSPSEELVQAAAKVLRNLSLKTDYATIQTMRDAKAVSTLISVAMEKEERPKTLKSVLDALWNLTASSTPNLVELTKVEGSIAFIVKLLASGKTTTEGEGKDNETEAMSTTKTSTPLISKTLTAHKASIASVLVESASGIFRNVSNYLVQHDRYVSQLTEANIVGILLAHLRAPSLRLVNNACKTLAVLSRASAFHAALLEPEALALLKNLIDSKHASIKCGVIDTLRNLPEVTSNPLFANGKDNRLDGCVMIGILIANFFQQTKPCSSRANSSR